MRIETLEFINTSLINAGINYEFGEWTSNTVPSPYFVGEYEEIEPDTEDGLQVVSFLLTGFGRRNWLELERAKTTIEKLFSKTVGKTAILGDVGIAVFYDRALIVPTGDAELKRIEIRLTIKEWSVN